MKTVAVIGGKLQGTEIAYLAKKAGFKSVLIEKRPHTPASGLCDEEHIFDVRKKESGLADLLCSADIVIPAVENDEALAALVALAKVRQFKLAFDPRAYAITSSKRKSDQIIHQNGVPAPLYFPHTDGPYIIKPSGGSGSNGVFRAETKGEAEAFLRAAENPEEWIAQEYLKGKSYSIEIIGIPGNYRTYEITQIHIDNVYDCRMVSAPCALPPSAAAEFADIARKLAGLVNLHGIMDVEVIASGGAMKVLEIDARFPSQTPAAVYHSTGVNMLSELFDITVGGRFQDRAVHENRHVAYEHYRIDADGAMPFGEHIMGQAGPLTWRQNFFGADEAVTDYHPDADMWCGIFINSGGSLDALSRKRNTLRKRLENWRMRAIP